MLHKVQLFICFLITACMWQTWQNLRPWYFKECRTPCWSSPLLLFPVLEHPAVWVDSHETERMMGRYIILFEQTQVWEAPTALEFVEELDRKLLRFPVPTVHLDMLNSGWDVGGEEFVVLTFLRPSKLQGSNSLAVFIFQPSARHLGVFHCCGCKSSDSSQKDQARSQSGVLTLPSNCHDACDQSEVQF